VREKSVIQNRPITFAAFGERSTAFREATTYIARYNQTVERLQSLTPEQLARAEQRLLRPAPASRIAAARDFGIDLTLLLMQLRLSPAERGSQMLELCNHVEELTGRARR